MHKHTLRVMEWFVSNNQNLWNQLGFGHRAFPTQELVLGWADGVSSQSRACPACSPGMFTDIAQSIFSKCFSLAYQARFIFFGGRGVPLCTCLPVLPITSRVIHVHEEHVLVSVQDGVELREREREQTHETSHGIRNGQHSQQERSLSLLPLVSLIKSLWESEEGVCLSCQQGAERDVPFSTKMLSWWEVLVRKKKLEMWPPEVLTRGHEKAWETSPPLKCVKLKNFTPRNFSSI